MPCLFRFSMLVNTKNQWKSLKNHCFFNDFADFTYFIFSAYWHRFWAISQWFWMDLPLKMTVKGLICFPLASLGSIWEQVSASLGQSWDSTVLNFWCPALSWVHFLRLRTTQTQFFQEFWWKMHQDSIKISSSSWYLGRLHRLVTS